MPNAERGTAESPVITRRSDGSVQYHYADETGDVVMTAYRVFPGIEVLFKDVHTASCIVDLEGAPGHILEIEHCAQGRAECQVGGEFFYLAPGDITIRRSDTGRRHVDFPLSHYHGVDIVIDLEQAPKSLNSLMADVDVEPADLVRKFALEDNAFRILRKLPNIEHIFSEMYSAPEAVRAGYLKVKVLEVLLFLTGLEQKREDRPGHGLSRAQVSRARRVHGYLMDHPTETVTIGALAERFEISPTNLKSVFRGVYGTSVMAFVRIRRMELAAQLLLETELSVADIAERFGYANAGKFSAAFRGVMGSTPKDYRAAGRLR